MYVAYKSESKYLPVRVLVQVPGSDAAQEVFYLVRYNTRDSGLVDYSTSTVTFKLRTVPYSVFFIGELGMEFYTRENESSSKTRKQKQYRCLKFKRIR